MCPGESVEKHILSCHDLSQHSEGIHVYTPRDIVNALDSEGFDATVGNPAASEAVGGAKKITENMGDLICFGSEEVRMCCGFVIHNWVKKELCESRVRPHMRLS